jgi:hypothetical protein
MTEQALLDYFQGKLSAEELAKDLKGSQIRSGYDTTSVYITPINSEEGEFIVMKEHLLQLCNDTLSGKLETIDLNTIAFALFTSDFFSRDDSSENSSVIENVVWDWDNPEIGYPLTLDNVKKWKEYLETGKYNLNPDELKR